MTIRNTVRSCRAAAVRVARGAAAPGDMRCLHLRARARALPATASAFPHGSATAAAWDAAKPLAGAAVPARSSSSAVPSEADARVPPPTVASIVGEVSLDDVEAFIAARAFESQQAEPEPGAALLLDVRSRAEFEGGTIPGARNIPIEELPAALDMLAGEFQASYGFKRPGRDAAVVSFCHSGARSEAATSIFRSLGYASSANYRGSYAEWLLARK